MTYSQYGLIAAADFNTFVGSPTTPINTANTLNSVWATGILNTGYGQTGVTQVVVDTIVSKDDWRNLIDTTRLSALHQGTSITQITPPNQGDKIEAIAAISTNLTNIYSNRLNAAAQGTTSTTTTVYNSPWSAAITFIHTITFSTGDAARYFFNAGGQIALTFSHPTGSGVNALLNNLSSACGTLVLSSLSSGTASIAGSTYSGITKVGGSGSTTTLSTNKGFYGLTASNQEVFKQLGTGTPSAYTGTFISVNLRLNASPGTGSILTITTLFDEVPNGGSTLGLTSGTTVNVTVRPPVSTYISNTWGTLSVVGSVSGS